jgi:hypothetical protein
LQVARNRVVKPAPTRCCSLLGDCRRLTLRRAICERFPPGPERDAWLAWAHRLYEGVHRPQGAPQALIYIIVLGTTLFLRWRSRAWQAIHL